MIKIYALTKHYSWWGKSSGYSNLTHYVDKSDDIEVVPVNTDQGNLGLLQKLLSRARYRQGRTSSVTARNVPILEKTLRRELKQAATKQIVHYLHVEEHYALNGRKHLNNPNHLVGSVHQPRSWWETNHLYHDAVRDFDGMITLSSELCDYMDKLGVAKTEFIPHGVDTVFFRPKEEVLIKTESRRILSVGHWLRDFNLMERVIGAAQLANLPWHFDIIVPQWKCEEIEILKIARHPNTTIAYGLTDDQLLQRYQEADAFFFPLIDCAANNAMVEAIACGLPIITSDLPGTRDYTQPSFCKLVRGEEPKRYIEAISESLQTEWQTRARKESRRYAESRLAWPIVANKMADFYRDYA